ncbi:MAG: hypothetical protein DLM62_15760 [Pseudonocardiales bacterium]|nr:MAG: hypothetical protein DLM62_15760 [Pseudonocardiales bacterium]
MNLADLDGEHVELLPARTVLSTISPRIPIGNASGSGSGLGGGDDVLNFTMSVLGMSGGNHGADGGSADGSNGGITS